MLSILRDLIFKSISIIARLIAITMIFVNYVNIVKELFKFVNVEYKSMNIQKNKSF